MEMCFEDVIKEYGQMNEFSELDENAFDLGTEDIGFENLMAELTWRKEF